MTPRGPIVLKGKYELGRKLGEGGMGAVYLAQHLLLHQPVAVKVMAPGAMESPTLLERFLREARALAAVRHPAVCQVFDVDMTDEGMPFIVMEYLEGQTFAELIKLAPETSVTERVRWIIEAAEGLAVAHANGVIHRDVKPANLMLCRGVVKVLDFGVAKRKEDGAITGDGVVGTMKYMSPEQLMGQQADARSDVWALAVTLYQVLSKQFPYDADTIGQYVQAVVTLPPRPLSLRGVQVPRALWEAVQRALRPLEERTPDMRTFADELRAAVSPPPPQAPRAAASRGPALLVGLALAGGALTFAGLQFVKGGQPSPSASPAREDRPSPKITSPSLPPVREAEVTPPAPKGTPTQLPVREAEVTPPAPKGTPTQLPVREAEVNPSPPSVLSVREGAGPPKEPVEVAATPTPTAPALPRPVKRAATAPPTPKPAAPVSPPDNPEHL